MGSGRQGTDRNPRVKRGARAPLYLRLLGRVTATLVALIVFFLVGVQFARVIHQNVALAGDLSSTNADIEQLRARQAWQQRELKRLKDPDGAIPDIHERLRLVRPDETMIFVSPAPSPAP